MRIIGQALRWAAFCLTMGIASVVFVLGFLASLIMLALWGSIPGAVFFNYIPVSAARSVFATTTFLTRIAKRIVVRNANEAMCRDPRPPVLYLRPFAADSRDLRNIDYFPKNTIFFETAEQALTRLLNSVGPVVAIGRPGEVLPTLGAARAYLADDL
jgi:hypothetical protein